MDKIIPYGRQSIDEEDIRVVTETLKADFLTQGPRIKELEDAFANYVGAEYAVAVSNGTAALHLSALSLNLQPGDRVITSPITFSASANCVRYCGGEVVFCDIDPETYLIDLSKLALMLKEFPKGYFKGIIPVDFAGRPVQMDEVRRLANQHDLWILEDSCHAPGGYLTTEDGQQSKCGSGQYADLAIFSFHPVKHIAAGEGGMITTNQEHLYKKLLDLRTHGITREEARFQNSRELAFGEETSQVEGWPGWYMEMQELGFNYRLTDIQAALASSQLKKADKGIARRRAIAARYAQALHGESFLLGHSGVVDGHAYHLYVVEVQDRAGLYDHLRKHKVFAQVHYIPVHLMPYYQKQGHQHGNFPYAEQYYSRCLSLPMYPTLTDEEQDYVIDLIKSYYHG